MVSALTETETETETEKQSEAIMSIRDRKLKLNEWNEARGRERR